MQILRVVPPALLVSIALSACSDTPTDPTGSPDLATGETDPAPGMPGLYLGSAVSGSGSSLCFDVTAANDRDQDQVTDQCEAKLAAGFAPQLAYFSGDRVGRESRWAAKRQMLASDGSSGVRIGYLLSYYFDDGTVGCKWGLVWCGGHYGDSEAVWLDLYYNPASQHWVLDRAEYSAHSRNNIYTRGAGPYPAALHYPGKSGGHPRAFVAYRKHANYANDASCDAGNSGLDDCRADRYQRVSAGSARNIGSRSVRLVDCVRSSFYTARTRTECYWTVKRFRGWQTRVPDADSYSDKLTAFGF
jgi:hypothetical protein